ncbi:hypothetical protein CH63R_07923 [Colletotrichum higginsianum IMI 349063]|uniref:Uncharacterized protein n=2 Tax=Colletotrichum higginsianum TaxID=80884 RepID=A0A1B7YB87_COLHI|nr:hypothetical protein CH63R_07923 [Colletotrichum higginsianum IMI 349063]OBR09158.1 hypothetical protein CH63R_07923 [Colletotrichum higginsianum IMI 349063]TIC96031.1 hypothetical protein CH35J_008224 [Colletotrichum higginsianum]
MRLRTTAVFLSAAAVFQGVSAQFCTGPPPDCNFEDEEMLPSHAVPELFTALPSLTGEKAIHVVSDSSNIHSHGSVMTLML